MSRHRVASLMLIPMAILSVAPAIPILGKQAYDFYRSRGRFQTFGYVGLDKHNAASILENFHQSQGGFQRAELQRTDESHATIDVFRIDPETGAGADDDTPAQKFVVPPESSAPADSYALFSDANRLWFVSRNRRVFEWNGSELVERESIPPLSHVNYIGGLRLLNVVHVINGRLSAIIESAGYRRELFQLIDGHWQSQGEFQLLDTARTWQTETGQTLLVPDLKPTPPNEQESSTRGSATRESHNSETKPSGHSHIGIVRILTVGSKSHLFWKVGSHWLCREGIELISRESGADRSMESASEFPASAADPENSVSIARDWLHVLDEASSRRNYLFIVAVDGEPAVILVDEPDDRSCTAKALRPINGTWTEFCSINLPFQSSPLITACRDNGTVSYLATVTGMGRTRSMALDASGFHPTLFHHIQFHDVAYMGYQVPVIMIVWSLLISSLSVVFGDVVLESRLAKDSMKTRTIHKRFLSRRGLARAIDFIILLTSTVAFYLILRTIFGLEEITALEANMARMKDHQQWILFPRILLASLTWLILMWLALIIWQGRTGQTPGKQLLKLRTLRTTLKPPGFASSLLRELLIYADSAGFLCWSVGILLIVFTRNQQRLGDLVADTIVIDTGTAEDRSRRSDPACYENELA